MISILKRTFSVVLLLIFFTMSASCGKNYTYEELQEIHAEISRDMDEGEPSGIIGVGISEDAVLVVIHKDCTYVEEIKKMYRRKYGGAVKFELDDYAVLY